MPYATSGSSNVSGANITDGSIGTLDLGDDIVTLAKVAHGTQGGLPFYGASGAPTELAAGTDGQVLETNGAGANPAWVNKPTCLSLIPQPNWIGPGGVEPETVSGNTALKLAQIVIPFRIVVGNLAFRSGTINTAGTYKIVLYSEDGQTKIFEIQTASVAGSGIINTAVSNVVVPPGIYYLGVLAVSTASAPFSFHIRPGTDIEEIIEDGTATVVIRGTLTVTADTIPATIDPTAIAKIGNSAGGLAVRLDT